MLARDFLHVNGLIGVLKIRVRGDRLAVFDQRFEGDEGAAVEARCVELEDDLNVSLRFLGRELYAGSNLLAVYLEGKLGALVDEDAFEDVSLAGDQVRVAYRVDDGGSAFGSDALVAVSLIGRVGCDEACEYLDGLLVGFKIDMGVDD